MKSANALLCLPSGGETLPAGTAVPAILIGDLPPPKSSGCHHGKVGVLRGVLRGDFPGELGPEGLGPAGAYFVCRGCSRKVAVGADSVRIGIKIGGASQQLSSVPRSLAYERPV